MVRTMSTMSTMRVVLLAGALAGSAPFAHGEPQVAAQRELEGNLTAMHERLASPGRSPQDVISGAQRLSAGYRRLEPTARGFTPADQALNRRIAQQSFAWLWRAQLLYGRNAAVGSQLLNTYGALGGFYRQYGGFYPAAAFTAYGGASRLARALVLGGGGPQYEQDLERYALAYATAAYAYGPGFDWWVQPTGAQEPPRLVSGQLPPTPKPTELPTVDTTGLSAEQRSQWTDVQARFRATSTHVHEARLRMNELIVRLQQQGLAVNVQDAATAAKMQGFLEDAVDLIKAKDFALAVEALTRADYQRTKLKSVIGG